MTRQTKDRVVRERVAISRLLLPVWCERRGLQTECSGLAQRPSSRDSLQSPQMLVRLGNRSRRGGARPSQVDGVVTLGRPVTCARAWHGPGREAQALLLAGCVKLGEGERGRGRVEVVKMGYDPMAESWGCERCEPMPPDRFYDSRIASRMPDARQRGSRWTKRTHDTGRRGSCVREAWRGLRRGART